MYLKQPNHLFFLILCLWRDVRGWVGALFWNCFDDSAHEQSQLYRQSVHSYCYFFFCWGRDSLCSLGFPESCMYTSLDSNSWQTACLCLSGELELKGAPPHPPTSQHFKSVIQSPLKLILGNFLFLIWYIRNLEFAFHSKVNKKLK